MKKQIINKKSKINPYNLKSTQQWFASVITYPLGEHDTIHPYSPGGFLIAEEAAEYIVPSPNLRPHQRMQIYNQQYWWRLLNTLHANFPLVTRLFGYHAFNEQIGIPYLYKYPPNHWSLTLLGERLSKWIMESYQEPDQMLIYNAARLDWAFTASFIASHYPPLDLPNLLQGNPENMLAYTLYLQPHIELFKWDYDLLSFRGAFLKQGVDYWLNNRFPKLVKDKTYRFVIYRNLNNNIAWREISEGEYLLLERFKTGVNLTEACEYIEKQDEQLYEEVSNHLQAWLQDWAQAGWLTLSSQQEDSVCPSMA